MLKKKRYKLLILTLLIRHKRPKNKQTKDNFLLFIFLKVKKKTNKQPENQIDKNKKNKPLSFLA